MELKIKINVHSFISVTSCVKKGLLINIQL